MSAELTPRQLRKQAARAWIGVVKNLFKHGLLPRLLISVKTDRKAGDNLTISVAHPGMDRKKATQLLQLAFQTMSREVVAEEQRNGPRIVIPS